MSSPHSNFDWADLDDGELIVRTQYAIAIYSNPKNDVVIRQESQYGEEEDTVILTPAHAVTVARAILKHAGYDDLVIAHVSRIIPQPTVSADQVDDSDMGAVGKPDKTAAERQRRRREKHRQRDSVTEAVTGRDNHRDSERDAVTVAPPLLPEFDLQNGGPRQTELTN
jgi:hypothetical protein